MSYVTYSEEEMNIVEGGITEIQRVLMGDDADQKRRLLFCLDRYMDPYFGYRLPFIEELSRLLETVVVSPNEEDVIEDALQLLGDYAYRPFKILEQNMEKIPEALRGRAFYVVNIHRIVAIEVLVNEECRRIFEEERASVSDPDILFPDKALLIHSQEITEDTVCYPTKDCDGLFSLQNGQIQAIGIPAGGLPKQRALLSRHCYQQAEFYYSIDLTNRKVILIYEFGPRWGRCFEYPLMDEGDDTYRLGEAEIKWVS